MIGQFRFHENPDTSPRRALSHLDEGGPEDHDEVPITIKVHRCTRHEVGQQDEHEGFQPRLMCPATSSSQ
ncbi:hypothetical protein B9Z55_021232 [Caenorhabditis nigoni]|uniref:Uncharacterized protein n=1 Tax=Caenorhabditis nigoni TaxID=1611254 RepID=A0A2G5TR82_9PELO|nr:hypothetical protein B9Z55_021232 [Caenorhabditis nigoni]